MPLGQRAGDASESRYCGAEVAYSEDIHHTLAANLAGGFDFIVAPLVRRDPQTLLRSFPPSLPPAICGRQAPLLLISGAISHSVCW
ncbi:unnamed protein product [Closterium sp. NIES-54]